MSGQKREIQTVKTKWVTIRLTEREKEIISMDAKSAGKNACAYVREVILSKSAKPLHQYGETA
jgi:uncharacterized protein (DUF1778 family)